jgi:hypothetical protein
LVNQSNSQKIFGGKMAKKKEQTKKTNQKRKREEVETKSKKVKENDKKDTNFENLSSSLNSIAESQTSATTDEDFRTLFKEEYLEETATIPLIRKLRVCFIFLISFRKSTLHFQKLLKKNLIQNYGTKTFQISLSQRNSSTTKTRKSNS